VELPVNRLTCKSEARRLCLAMIIGEAVGIVPVGGELSTKITQPVAKPPPAPFAERIDTNAPRFCASDCVNRIAAERSPATDCILVLSMKSLRFGIAIAASMATTATVTISSTKVKPFRFKSERLLSMRIRTFLRRCPTEERSPDKRHSFSEDCRSQTTGGVGFQPCDRRF
jgi:hypothetical protein